MTISLAGLVLISLGFTNAIPIVELNVNKTGVDVCEVSHWTEWSRCQGSCELGYQVRNREVTKPSLPVDGILLHPCPYLYEVKYCTPTKCFTDPVVTESPSVTATLSLDNESDLPSADLLQLLNQARSAANTTSNTSTLASPTNIKSVDKITVTPVNTDIEKPQQFVPFASTTRKPKFNEGIQDRLAVEKPKDTVEVLESIFAIPIANQPPVVHPTFENAVQTTELPREGVVFTLDQFNNQANNIIAKPQVWNPHLNQTNNQPLANVSNNQLSKNISSNSTNVASTEDHKMIYQEPLMSDNGTHTETQEFPSAFDNVVTSNIPIPQQFSPKTEVNKTNSKNLTIDGKPNNIDAQVIKIDLFDLSGPKTNLNDAKRERTNITIPKTDPSLNSSQANTSINATSNATIANTTVSPVAQLNFTVPQVSTVATTIINSNTTATTAVQPTTSDITTATPKLIINTTTTVIATTTTSTAPPPVTTTQKSVQTSTDPIGTPIIIKEIDVPGLTKEPLPLPYDPRNSSTFQFPSTATRTTTPTPKTTTKAPVPTPIIIREIGVGTTLDLTSIQRQRKQEITTNGASKDHFTSRAINPRCHPVQARGKCPGGSKAQQVNRWVRMPGLEECSLYSYPYCNILMEKEENPIRLEEECYKLCYSDNEKNNMELFKRIQFADGFRVDRI